MTEQVPIRPADTIAWASVHEAVNALRGRCFNAFARAEQAVTEALDRLSRDAARGAGVKLPHLVGQRFEALAARMAHSARRRHRPARAPERRTGATKEEERLGRSRSLS